jgi:hypothetical protein
VSFLRRLARGSRGIPEPPPFTADRFEPASDLERALVGGDPETIRAALLAARLFVPSRADASSMTEGDEFRPIVLDYDPGPCVAVLSSQSRLQALLPAVPDVASCIEVDASWVIASCPRGLGLAINPGWREGVVLDAQAVETLRR